MQFIHSILTTIGPFFLLLGVLIFVHEFGHFIVAKFFGVRVEVFSLGFGKKILQYKKGDTTYCLSLIPLGGYVKMYGDDPNKEIPKEEQQFSF
ncbi:MAG: site-2 protease family protein, partial [Bdellovibrionales bacterium]|nr:site-2 protease family protein [Bdellovibrionales bacterium]